MKPATLFLAALLVLPAAAPAAAPAQQARITMAAARARALALVPGGRIASAELEREHGRLIYSFDIRTGRPVGSSRVDLQACKLEYSIVSPK